jgi:hypothetical protein
MTDKMCFLLIFVPFFGRQHCGRQQDTAVSAEWIKGIDSVLDIIARFFIARLTQLFKKIYIYIFFFFGSKQRSSSLTAMFK